MAALNKVIAGDYQNWTAQLDWSGGISIVKPSLFGKEKIKLDKSTIAEYELVTEETMKSGTSAVARGAVGAVLLGPVGLLAGLSAKNKGVYNVAIMFKDGRKSLLEIDDLLYKELMKRLF